MKTLLLAVVILAQVAVGRAGTWIMSTNMNIATLNGVVNPYSGTDSSVPAYLFWLYDTSDPSYQGSNTLTRPIQNTVSFQSGTAYRVFVKAYDYQDKKFAVTLGDQTVANTQTMSHSDFNRHWTGPTVITPTATSTNLSITFYRTNYPATDVTAKYLMEGVYITTNIYEDIAEGGQDIVQTFRVPAALTNNVVAGNKLMNSSFELGPNAHGWGGIGHSSAGRGFLMSDMWDSSTAVHGKYSLKFTEKATIYSAPIRLSRPNQTFTLSFYAKVSPNYLTIDSLNGHVIYLGIDNILTAPEAQASVTNYLIQFNLTTNWVRYTTNVTIYGYPTNWVQFSIHGIGKMASTAETFPSQWVDAAQFEEGSAATTYAPKNAVEIGIGIENMAHTFHFGENREFKVYSYNAGSAVTNTFLYEIRDVLNAPEASGSPSLVLPAGNGTNTINMMAVTKYGVHRILGRIDSEDDETSFAFLAVDGTTNRNSTDLIGTHPNGNRRMAEVHRAKWGFSASRGLSPMSIFRWATTEAVQGTYVWPTNRIISSATNGLDILASMSTDFEWPSWANATVNGETVPNATYYSNWVYQAVNTWKGSISAWEFWNEPQYVTPINVSSYAHRITMTKMFIGAVRAADPEAKIIIGGGETDATRSLAIWNGLTGTEQGFVHAFSLHIYPDQGGVPTMGPQTETRFDPFISAFGSAVTFWNTESGSQDLGGFLKGKSSAFKLFGEAYNPYQRAKRYFGILNDADMLTYVAVRSVGTFGGKFYNYDSRNTSSHPGDLPTTHTGYEHFDALHPKLYNMAWLNQTLKGFSSHRARYTNANNAYLEAYGFSSGSIHWLCVLNADYTNRYITLNQTAFTQYDTEGNLVSRSDLSRVYLNRRPTWLKTTALTTNQFITAFTGATATTTSDATAPKLSIDITPSGVLSTNESTVFFKWFPQDDTYMPDDSTPTNVVCRYKLVGHDGDWSSWSQETIALYQGLSLSGSYHLEVEARDVAGNTSSASGPVFSFGATAGSPPTITSIADRSIYKDTATGVLAFTVGSSSEPAGDLTVTVTSSNHTLADDADCALGGSGANRTVNVTPNAGQTGITTITITVTDSEDRTANDSFDLTVLSVPVAPTGKHIPKGRKKW